jgi:hypothetical protein
MPLKLNVGLTKKIGQPNYGSLGATCHVEIELDQALLEHDENGFQERIRRVFTVCSQAVTGELMRQSHGNTRQALDGPVVRDRARRATPAQVRAIRSIAEHQEIDVDAWARKEFGVEIDALSILEASQLIDDLKGVAGCP